MPFDYSKNRRKFTAKLVQDFVCESGKDESLLWDEAQRTLCIRARASGNKSYYYQGRLNGRVIKIRIGAVSDTKLTFDDVRCVAARYDAIVKEGRDPRLVIRENLKEAEAERLELMRSDRRFDEALNAYIEANRDDWGEQHLNDYLKVLEPTKRGRNGILYTFRNYKLSDFTKSNVLKWIRLEKKYRATSVAKGYRLLRACLHWADGQEEFSGIVDLQDVLHHSEIKKALPKPKAKSDTLTKHQVKVWFEEVRKINNPSISAALQTLLLTGARRQEILTLRWSNVDFHWKSLKIKDKVEGDRVIPLTPYVESLLSKLPRRNKWVFSSATSESGRVIEPYIAHKQALQRAELPAISIHGLRRSFSSLSEWAECPAGATAQIMGHKPSAIAEKHYKPRSLDLLQMWHNKVEAKILEFAEINLPDELDSNIKLVRAN